eukprot:CAMPEP_0206476290 /NCGR_PEP_ID=MMETSP0324_2-20121206/34630_1 /ASSEMBLY_ACC=CAM_ASM_000836 /TAXON_ID=2866 /ORGANISM="Crypthecodinium cohnii, Strain Seligo" /LENGTH=40 /DNA_ID= /DNA_START= /DNA_END= /DNA_ORIENTATION=
MYDSIHGASQLCDFFLGQKSPNARADTADIIAFRNKQHQA